MLGGGGNWEGSVTQREMETEKQGRGQEGAAIRR